MNLNSLPPGSTANTTIVRTKISIDGTELSGEVLLIQFSVQKIFNRVSSAKISFRDGNVAERDFPLSNEEMFKPGSSIQIRAGYEGEMDSLFEGIITGHRIEVRPNGISYLHIEAKDKAIKLVGARKSNYYIDKKDSDVMEEILDGAGLDNEIAATNGTNKQLVQYNSTDWDFLVIRSEANGMFVFTDDGTVTIQKPDMDQTVLSVTYGDNILDFEAEMDVRRQYHSVTASTWDYKEQELKTSDPGNMSFTETGNVDSANLASVLDINRTLMQAGKLDSIQLQDWANSMDLRGKMAKVTGRVRITGNAEIKPGKIIKLGGVGDRFSGNVLVTGIKHYYSGNWFTDVQFGWADDLFYKKEDVMDKPAAGLLPGVNGLEIGIVEDVDDPEGQYRIKVKLPSVMGLGEGIWARVVMPDAGNNRGMYFRPEVKDEVIVGFLNDDPNNPVVLGSLYSSDNRQPPLLKTDSNIETGIVTGENSKLVFNDSKKSLSISVMADDGAKKFVLNDSGNIAITDGLGNKITMGTSGITIESAGIITIKGAMVKIN